MLKDLLTEGGKLVWENREKVQAALKAIHRWWKSKKTRVLVIGAGGTGKTTLARFLAGEIDFLTHNSWDYTQSYAVEKLQMTGSQEAEVIVAPGQPHRRESWKIFKEQIIAGKFSGIILVNSFGYHSLNRSTLKLAGDSRSKQQALEEHLDQDRNEEIAILQELSGPIKASLKQIWLMSLVTKQDLWYDEIDEVRQHYSKGPYSEVISDIRSVRPETTFRSELELVSLVISNLTAERDKILKKNVAGFDHRIQVQTLQALLNCIAQLIVWEIQK
jgi:energy-coupling factor transporter ATP-binding protein EcfA2